MCLMDLGVCEGGAAAVPVAVGRRVGRGAGARGGARGSGSHGIEPGQ